MEPSPGGPPGVQTFAEELQWCISQLEIGLQRQSPDSRQAAETVKVLKILRSPKAPMVKKRQAMRNALGDYRKKMREAEKKSLSGLHHSRFQPVGRNQNHTKCRYLKHSHTKQQSLVKEEFNTNFSNLHLQQGESPSCGIETAQNLRLSDHQTFNLNTLPPPSNQQSSLAWASTDNGDFLNSSNQSSVLNDDCRFKRQIHNSQGPNISDTSSSCSKQPGNRASNSDAGHSLFTDQGCYKFVPTDNSFLFGFEDPTETKGDENISLTKAQGEDIGGKLTDGNLVIESAAEKKCMSQNVGQNAFKFDKSNNEFTFNFSGDADN